MSSIFSMYYIPFDRKFASLVQHWALPPTETSRAEFGTLIDRNVAADTFVEYQNKPT